MIGATAFAQPHDGHWWQSTVSYQRQEYLNGYMDCAIYDGERRDLPSIPTNEIEQAIQTFYEAHPKALNTPAIKVLDFVSKQRGMHRKPPEGGEQWTDKHGYYDGEYWPISKMEQIGFVQGLRDCYAALPSGLRFSRSDDFYVRHISIWYASHRHKLHTKIANVLAIYVDHKTEDAPTSPKQTGPTT